MSTMVVNDILTDADAHVATWIEDKLGGDVVSVPFRAVGIVGDNGKLIGGAYFYNHREPNIVDGKKYGGDIYAAVALEEGAFMTPDVVSKILAFPFGQLDLPRVSVDIDENNTHAIEQAERLGFQPEGIKEGAGPTGGDIIMFGLKRDNCKFWRAQK